MGRDGLSPVECQPARSVKTVLYSSAASLVQPRPCRTLRTLREGCAVLCLPSARLSTRSRRSPPCPAPRPMEGRPTKASLADPGDAWRFPAIPGNQEFLGQAPPPGSRPWFPQLFSKPPLHRLSSSADLLSSCRASPGDQTVS
jgi:hypothetical protein